MNKSKWIRSLCCCVCGKGGEWLGEIGEYRTQAAHVRRANNSGIGCKPSDEYLVPLCSHCHKFQHQHGESALGADLMKIALLLDSKWKKMI